MRNETISPAPTGIGNGARRSSYDGASTSKYTESPAAKLLSRLDKVRETGRGQWLACCPAHDDKSPSLSIRETGDGTLLLHCFASCEAAEVVAAAGLEMRDLFPDHGEHRRPIPKGARWDWRGMIRALSHETTVVTLAANDLANGRALSSDDHDRLNIAMNRIERIAEVAR